jgi:thiamine pyrophosphate-dependent acetolactate synthase large subunit-like protein
MPYSLTTPSGQVINDIPDDVPQAEALRQLQMRRPELFSKPTSPYSITTPSGQVINDIPADVPREQALENLKRAQPNLFVTQPTVKPGEEELPSQEQADNQSFWRSVARRAAAVSAWCVTYWESWCRYVRRWQ